MTIAFKSVLMNYLEKQSSLYFGKIQELRDVIEQWLSYIPQTFPHYTRHTIQHSDEIVLQLSNLLFKDDSPDKPVVALSPSETYILIAGAYLHDAGMVVSDQEKATILSSDEWKSWTSGDGGGTKRWNEIQEFRQKLVDNVDLHNFVSDIQTRFLIAEFLRRTHHQRSASVITQHQSTLGRFAFDDPVMRRTIADVCLAHGLRQHELDDNERFPERRDIRGDKVNVRFLAIMLRIGDLLDLSYDRACPLLLNAVCPLPPESLAYWSQYQRVTHRMTAPDRIEIIAECETQEEHRFLLDWCQWLVNELREARNRMARATRHNDWIPPIAEIDSGISSIVIRRSKSARYIPSKWVFELDNDAVFDLLINKPYADPFAFIRELIQNALDATRCQMYADISTNGREPPEYPTQVDKQYLDRYPLKISLENRQVMNHLSGETESRQVLIVNDCGIGMDREIIERYFLQVGRSYYTTEEFQRTFRFTPTSHFGVGFLSVFAASDRVVVETFKPKSQHNDDPIRLTLTGPRNYLLTDCGDRRTSGTCIEVLLREPLETGKLTNVVSSWCRRVEFPIVVDDLGIQTTIQAERPEQFTYEAPDVTEENAKFVVRSFPLNRSGIEGELYVFARISSMGESWAERGWATIQYPSMNPAASAPRIPHSLVCLHGIALSREREGFFRGSMISRIDYRRQIDKPTLSREAMFPHHPASNLQINREIQSRWEEILTEHLVGTQWARSNDGWKYKQKLVGEFPILSFWASVDGLIPIYMEGEQRFVSLAFVQDMRILGTTMSLQSLLPDYYYIRHEKIDEPVPAWDSSVAFITGSNLKHLSDEHMREIFINRKISNVRWLSNDHLAIDWIASDDIPLFASDRDRPIMLAEISESDIIGFTIHKTTGTIYGATIINKNNKFIRWLIAIKNACFSGKSGLLPEQFKRLMSLLDSPLHHRGYELEKLRAYVEGWKLLRGLEPDLYPPVMEITADMFLPPRVGAILSAHEDKFKRVKEVRKKLEE